MKKVIVLAGLGFGDETKGATAHWLCGHFGAHTVVRTGAPQALHTVVTASGKEHTFSHFGSGSLVGAGTFLSRHMIVDPYALVQEGQALQDLGVTDIFDRMAIDENALVITPFQALANRLREYARGANRHGTVGIGVGETVSDGEILGDAAVRMKDLGKPWLWEKIETIHALKKQQLQPSMDYLMSLQGEDAWLDRELTLFFDREIIDRAVSYFNHVAYRVSIVDSGYLGELLSDGVTIFEPSQGVLLDQWFGFYPYVTKACPMVNAALELIAEQGYGGEVTAYGITRAYHTRHGAGPFVTEDAKLSAILPDMHNGTHKWQGVFRVGQLDAVALRYAVAASGGKEIFSGLVVACLDRLKDLSKWQICNRYYYEGDASSEELKQFFIFEQSMITDIVVRQNTYDDVQLSRQMRLGQLLRECRPVFDDVSAGDYAAYNVAIMQCVHVPIVATAFGPSETHRQFIDV